MQLSSPYLEVGARWEVVDEAYVAHLAESLIGGDLGDVSLCPFVEFPDPQMLINSIS